MGKKISISQLSAAVMEELEEYADLAAEDMKSAVKKAAATVRKDIEASAPRNTGDYAKSWAVKTTKESSNSLLICWSMGMRSGAAAGLRQGPISLLRKRLELNSWSVRLRGA